MPAEVFFTPATNTGALTLVQLSEELKRAGLAPRIAENEAQQLWIEFDGFESRLLTMKEEPLSLITLQVYDDIDRGMALAKKIEEVLQPHGYIDAEQLLG